MHILKEALEKEIHGQDILFLLGIIYVYTFLYRVKSKCGNIAGVKCLSLNQPYAELLVSGKKTIEVRRWNTNFRGPFLVHASKKINEEACNRLKIDPAKLVTGAIVGKANDVISYPSKNSFLKDKNKHFASSNYVNPKYGFLINQIIRFENPIPIRGKIGFFNVEDSEKEHN